MITIQATKNHIRMQKIVAEWPARIQELRRQSAYLLASFVLDEIKKIVPTRGEGADYLKGLEVVKIGANREANFAVAARPIMRNLALRKKDTVLYVKPKKKWSSISQGVRVLIKYSPWTVGTLPFSPPSSEAKIISRRVTSGEVVQVSKDRAKDRKRWANDLKSAGVKVSSKKTSVNQAERDLVFEVLRSEMGWSGATMPPHWRLAINNAKIRAQRMLKHYPHLGRLLVSRTWKEDSLLKSLPGLPESSGTAFIEFQGRIGF